VEVEKLLTDWRFWLKRNGLLVESFFDHSNFQLNDRIIEYSGIQARYIIFCDGMSSAQNPYFDKLPFALNKGEGLLVEIKGIPQNLVFKKGMSLVPYSENIFWLGSSYEWAFDDGQPSRKLQKNCRGAG
jgi:hypothetical protein